MKKYNQLTDCLLKLIKVQIEKYTGLANIGVGPDAAMNGYLVVEEVNALLQFAQTMIGLIEAKKEDEVTFKSIFSQAQFYLDQEYLRGYAGWLIDENNIHSTEYNRLRHIKNELDAIINEHAIAELPKAEPVNDSQRQCEQDSRAIAYKITNLVVTLKQNPAMELDESYAPKHAQTLLRGHAKPGGRYHQPQFSAEIERIQQECGEFLAKSNIETSTRKLTPSAAQTLRLKHEHQFRDSLARYKDCNGSSSLFSEDAEWYKIASGNRITHLLEPAVHTQGIFHNRTALLLSVGAVAIAMLIYNLIRMTNVNSPGNAK